MFRLLAKLYIQRSLDYEKAVPKWVEHRLQWDKNLAKYRHELVILQDKLKCDASAWLSNRAQNEDKIPRPVTLSKHTLQASLRTQIIRDRVGRYRFSIAYLSLAALALLAFVWIATSYQCDVVDSNRHLAHTSHESVGVRAQDERMVKLAVTSAERIAHQVQLIGLNQGKNASATSNFLSQVQNKLPSKSELDRWNSKSIAKVRNCVETAGKSTGLFLNEVGSGFRGTESDLSDQLGTSVNSLRQSLSGFTQSLSKSILRTP